MSSSINLISEERGGGSKEERVKKLKNLSYFLLLIVGFLAILVFLLNYRFSANAIRGEQEKLLTELSSYDESAVKIYLLNRRVTDTSNIINNRKKYNKIIAEITNDLTPTIIIGEFEIENSQIKISASSTSLEGLNDFLNHMLTLSSSQVISNVSLETLSLGGSLYNMSIKASTL